MNRQDNFFIVITTFNRRDYLKSLFDSISQLSPAPAGVVVIDNASTDDTEAVVTATELGVPLHYRRLDANVGGSGGFSAGVDFALSLGAQWMWLMDDDVTAIPDAIGALGPWMEKYDAIVGRRYDAAGEPFYWQNNFSAFLGFPLPVRGDVFASSDEFLTNVGCFEGMLVHRDAVEGVGLPDPRFFLNWDDTMYGWQISLQRPVVYVNAFTLRKAREQRQIDLGIRHLNDSSDLSRYYVMRNRGLVAQYLKAHGRFNRFGFGIGTVLTGAKELTRLVLVERSLRGSRRLFRGWRDSREIMADTQWQPMPRPL